MYSLEYLYLIFYSLPVKNVNNFSPFPEMRPVGMHKTKITQSQYHGRKKVGVLKTF